MQLQDILDTNPIPKNNELSTYTVYYKTSNDEFIEIKTAAFEYDSDGERSVILSQ